jgi:hypothetical protein
MAWASLLNIRAPTEADARYHIEGQPKRPNAPLIFVYLKTIVTLSARTGGRNDRVGNVLIEPIQDDVEDCEIVRAQHVHALR